MNVHGESSSQYTKTFDTPEQATTAVDLLRDQLKAKNIKTYSSWSISRLFNKTLTIPIDEAHPNVVIHVDRKSYEAFKKKQIKESFNPNLNLDPTSRQTMLDKDIKKMKGDKNLLKDQLKMDISPMLPSLKSQITQKTSRSSRGRNAL